MSQKSTSNSKILSRLKEKVKEVEKEKLYWYERWQTVCASLDERTKTLKVFQDMEISNKRFEDLVANREINDLKEIIRALINTFNPSKTTPDPSTYTGEYPHNTTRGKGSNY